MTLRHEIILMDQEEEEEEATIPGVSQGATGNIGALTKLFSPFGETHGCQPGTACPHQQLWHRGANLFTFNSGQ